MSNKTKEIFLKDYKTPNYWVNNLDLAVDIHDDHVIVYAETVYEQNEEHKQNDLQLHGVDLELLSVKINDEKLDANSYHVNETGLFLSQLPQKFTLQTMVKIKPEENFTGEGFYKSGNIYCTQCEAEGFRRITYFLDRPDVMTSYRVRMTAQKERFPKLLANGNMVESGELEAGRHFAVWEDPFKKPSYLFAMVAGDLAVVDDVFKTKSNREVKLEIYVDHGNEHKCDHAMRSLKNAMKWDEDKFGLEYDLDIYMIVAVDSFNMGAMENKGLNIFNSSYVLANKETATDKDFAGVEAVIGHEYFHNWTGNRVTCRDWFQLTLKEGLTVFRDQEFSSDMLSRPVKRIEDVKGLRGHQFPEDAGPLSHPIKPKSFVEINNFYTATIYEKGAEVIRMIHTLLGEDGFRKGMDLYFKRHDGQAVTTEDFVAAMADANNVDLEQFKVWYDQNGTPKLEIQTNYNEQAQQFEVKINQKAKLNNSEFSALHMPFHLSLYAQDGTNFSLAHEGKLELKDKESTFVFDNITSEPIASFNENFTAPVIVDYNYSQEQLCTLMVYCKDEFNQFNAAQKLAELEIHSLVAQAHAQESFQVSSRFIEAYGELLKNESLDDAFKAYALSIPGVKAINDKSEKFDFDFLPQAIGFLEKVLADEFFDVLSELIQKLEQNGEFSLSSKAMGERSLRNFALSLLVKSQTNEAYDLVYNTYKNASNMTDKFSALKILANKNNKYRDQALSDFYEQWKHETLVMQKWLNVQASSDDMTLDKMQQLESLEIYNPKVPNLLRSLIGIYGAYNINSFHRNDGSGYQYYTDKIIEVDKYNPQIAAGMCKRLNFLKKLDDIRAKHLCAQLQRIKAISDISNDTYEVVEKNLAD
ncbi:MAG: aminopeptidase N [Bacteriovoracaceae bacterium]|jgi:aminopeptidase N|nr:aminopeptidase N [Bacteriovoracaceae bacterium]